MVACKFPLWPSGHWKLSLFRTHPAQHGQPCRTLMAQQLAHHRSSIFFGWTTSTFLLRRNEVRQPYYTGKPSCRSRSERYDLVRGPGTGRLAYDRSVRSSLLGARTNCMMQFLSKGWFGLLPRKLKVRMSAVIRSGDIVYTGTLWLAYKETSAWRTHTSDPNGSVKGGLDIVPSETPNLIS